MIEKFLIFNVILNPRITTIFVNMALFGLSNFGTKPDLHAYLNLNWDFFYICYRGFSYVKKCNKHLKRTAEFNIYMSVVFIKYICTYHTKYRIRLRHAVEKTSLFSYRQG